MAEWSASSVRASLAEASSVLNRNSNAILTNGLAPREYTRDVRRNGHRPNGENEEMVKFMITTKLTKIERRHINEKAGPNSFPIRNVPTRR